MLLVRSASAAQRSQHSVAQLLRLYASAAAPSGSTVVEVKNDADFQQLSKEWSTANGKLAIVDFTAKWCGPCRMIAPIYEKLSQRYPEVAFTKVDIDQPGVGGTVTDHSISGVPTFVFYKGGRRVEAFSGARPEMLEELIKKHTK